MPAEGFSQQIVEFTDCNVGRQVSLFQDRENALTLDSAVQLQAMGRFKLSGEQIINLGNSKSAFWMHLAYIVPRDRKLYLLLDVANIDYVDFYTWDGENTLVQVHTGSLSASVPGVSLTNTYCFELPPAGGRGKVRSIFMKVRSDNIMLIPLKLIDASDISRYEKTKTGLETIYSGVLLMLLVLNIFLFFILKDRTFLYYSIYCGSLLVYVVLYLRGYSYIFGNEIRVMVNLYPHVFSGLASLAAFLFSWEFLGIKTRVPGLVWLYKLMFFAWLSVIVVALFGGKALLAVPNNYLALFSCLVAIYAGWRAYVNGLRPALYYILAWGAVAIAFVVTLLGVYGIIPYRDVSYQVVPIGTSVEMLFLCFAIAKRFGYLRSDSQRIAGENLQLILSQNERLEMVVNERTENLSRANADKNRLLSIVAHDLRSPFNSLRSILELTSHGMLDMQELKMLLSKVMENVDQIQLTLDNLLFWAKGQMQAPGTIPQLFSLSELVNSLCLVYRPLAISRDILIKCSLPANCHVYADQNEISLVIRNLLDNALKFSPTKAVIEIDYQSSEGVTELRVTNSADPKGIDKLRQISRTAQFLNSPGQSSGTGTGLGLFLCLQYVQSNRGMLDVTVSNTSVAVSFTLPEDIQAWEKMEVVDGISG